MHLMKVSIKDNFTIINLTMKDIINVISTLKCAKCGDMNGIMVEMLKYWDTCYVNSVPVASI